MPAAVFGNPSPKRADRSLSHYVSHTLYPYSRYYRDLLDETGIGRRGIRSRGDLVRLPPTDLASVSDPGALVLRPDRYSMRRYGDRALVLRSYMSRLLGVEHRFNSGVLEPRFKPLHWTLCSGVPIGSSQADLVKLGTLGAHSLALAGVTDRDVLLSVLPPGPSVAHWQLVQGARTARVAAIHLDPALDGAADRMAMLGPSVVAGHPADLIRVLGEWHESGRPMAVLIVLCVGATEPVTTEERAAVAEQAGGATVVASWAPPGVRALWTECRRAAVASVYDPALVPPLHSWPACEVLESGPDGELLWTAVGWAGSPLVRLRTGIGAVLQDGPCRYCGESGVLVRPVPAGVRA